MNTEPLSRIADGELQEIAERIDRHLHLDQIMQLEYALSVAPAWVVREEVKKFTDACEARKDDAPPPPVARRTFRDFE